MDLLGKVGEVLYKGLKLREKRIETVSSNIANASTPNYIPKKLNFEEEFQKIVNNKKDFDLKTTDSRHFKINPYTNLKNFDVEPENKYRAPIGMDRNMVDLEEEYNILVKDGLTYKAISQILAKKALGLKTLIDELGKV